MKLLLTAFLLVTGIAWAQGSYQAVDPDMPMRLSDPDLLLVRLSYERWPGQQTCIAVFQDGEYGIITPSDTRGDRLRLKGKMADDQLLRLKKMLAAPGFRSLSSNAAGMIRDHAENFRAEVSRVELEGDKTQVHPGSLAPAPRRLHWLNADDENPFPAPIAKLVDWMENFKPKNAKPFDDREFRENVCPSVGLSLVQPSVATNGRP